MKKRFYLSTLIPMGAVLCFMLCGTLILNAGYGFLWVPAREVFNGKFAKAFFTFHTILCMAMFMAALFFSFNYFWHADDRRRLKTVLHGVSLAFSVLGLASMLYPLCCTLMPLHLQPAADDVEYARHFGMIFFYYLPAGLAKIGVLLSSVVLVFTLDPHE